MQVRVTKMFLESHIRSYAQCAYTTPSRTNQPIINAVHINCHILYISPHASSCIYLQVLAGTVTQENLDEGRVYPPLSEIQNVSVKIAVAVVEQAYQNQMAAQYPEPDDKLEFVKSQMYSTCYESFLPDLYDWPLTAVSQCRRR